MRVGQKKAGQVLAFPALKAIPAPSFPLQGAAYEKYLALATGLLNTRKLNTFTREKCELLAILHGKTAKRLELGQSISTKDIENMSKLMKELQLVDESESTAPEESAGQNRFSAIGVVLRRGTQKAEIRPS
jgi:hypothetical protein